MRAAMVASRACASAIRSVARARATFASRPNPLSTGSEAVRRKFQLRRSAGKSIADQSYPPAARSDGQYWARAARTSACRRLSVELAAMAMGAPASARATSVAMSGRAGALAGRDADAGCTAPSTPISRPSSSCAVRWADSASTMASSALPTSSSARRISERVAVPTCSRLCAKASCCCARSKR